MKGSHSTFRNRNGLDKPANATPTAANNARVKKEVNWPITTIHNSEGSEKPPKGTTKLTTQSNKTKTPNNVTSASNRFKVGFLINLPNLGPLEKLHHLSNQTPSESRAYLTSPLNLVPILGLGFGRI